MAMAVAFAFLHRVVMSLSLASIEPLEVQSKISGQSVDILKGNIKVQF